MTDSENSLRDELNSFIKRNFPQIAMHGGEFGITELNEEEGFVRITLGGTCSGCGISPMTIQALQKRLPGEIDEIERVEAETMGGETINTPTPQRGTSDEDNGPDAPF